MVEAVSLFSARKRMMRHIVMASSGVGHLAHQFADLALNIDAQNAELLQSIQALFLAHAVPLAVKPITLSILFVMLSRRIVELLLKNANPGYIHKFASAFVISAPPRTSKLSAVEDLSKPGR